MKDILVIIPTHNESENIEILISRILKYLSSLKILIVDGGSTDSTVEKVKKLIQREKRLFLLEENEKRGLGRAYISGFKWGLENGYSRLVEMDADLSHRVRDLSRLLEVDSDLVIGSRWIEGGGIDNWSRPRELLSRFANKYVQFMLHLNISDATSGFRTFSSEILRRIDLDSIRSEGYTFQIEMVRAARKVGAQIIEVPITFRERAFGKSKISRAIVLEAFIRVTYWGMRRIGGGGGI